MNFHELSVLETFRCLCRNKNGLLQQTTWKEEDEEIVKK
ncbi:hypothetical protein ACJIZ3_020793 [Penstemon smallii]|uniref:Uncharacterized protein n=1 Tax=Penstemon smallii TaxID=265156 RepID=A0ABD3SJL4_9LAMI